MKDSRETAENELPQEGDSSADPVESKQKDQSFPTQTKFVLRIECSGGTYIRSLIRDIAHSLNTVAYMAELERTRQGIFMMEDALEMDDVDEDCEKVRKALQEGVHKMNKHLQMNKEKS